MKLTKLKLQQIIQEEFENVNEIFGFGKKEPELSTAERRKQRQKASQERFKAMPDASPGKSSLGQEAAKRLGIPSDRAPTDEEYQVASKRRKPGQSADDFLTAHYLAGKLSSQNGVPPRRAELKRTNIPPEMWPLK